MGKEAQLPAAVQSVAKFRRRLVVVVEAEAAAGLRRK